MATFSDVKPEIDKALAYLKTCKKFSTPEAREALQTLSQLYFKNSNAIHECISYLVSQGYGQLFGKMWNNLKGYLEKKKWGKDGHEALDLMLGTYFDFTDSSPELAAELGKCGYIPELLKGLQKLEKYFEKEEDYEMIEESVKCIMFLLSNSIARCSSNRAIYRKAGAYGIFKKYLKSTNPLVSLVSLIILAYVADETERGILATSDGGVAILVKWLQACVESPDHKAEFEDIDGSAKETVQVLNRLALNDSNKLEIQKQGGIPAIVQMLGDDFDEEEHRLAAEVVWNLAFVEPIRTSAQLQEAVPYLDELRNSANKDLRRISGYAFWEIKDNQPEDLPTQPTSPQEPPPSYEESIQEPQGATANTAQVMISYQWDFQPIAVQIRDGLVSHGFKVWLDLTNLRDSILASMADAVEKSDIILMLMSEAYKDSQSCRTEGEYAYKKKKKVIPLLVQQDYDPDGWLGAVLGAKLYYKFFTEDLSKTDMPQLLTALRESAQATGAPDEPDGPITPTKTSGLQASPPLKSQPSASNWTEKDVQVWLKKMKLDDACDALDGFDGSALEVLYQDLTRDPKEFKDEMRSDYQMSAKLCVKFTAALKKLFQK